MEFYWQKLKDIRKSSGLSVNFVISKIEDKPKNLLVVGKWQENSKRDQY